MFHGFAVLFLLLPMFFAGSGPEFPKQNSTTDGFHQTVRFYVKCSIFLFDSNVFSKEEPPQDTKQDTGRQTQCHEFIDVWCVFVLGSINRRVRCL